MNRSMIRIDGTVTFDYILIGIGVVFMLIVITNLQIAKPARKASSELEQIVGKIADNRGDLMERITVKSKDEIGQLAEGINGFMSQLQGLMQNLQMQSERMMNTANAFVRLAENSRQMLDFVEKDVVKHYDSFVEIVNQYEEDAELMSRILGEFGEQAGTINETMNSMNFGIENV